MNKYITLFEQFLNNADLDYKLHETDPVEGLGYLTFKMNGDYCRMDVVFDADPERDMVMCFVYLPFSIPPEKRHGMAELVCRLNRRAVGNYEYDIDDLSLRFKISMDVEGGELVPRMIENMRDSAVSVCDNDFPVMMRFLYGDFSPKAAYEAGRPAGDATTEPGDKPPQGVVMQ